MDINEIRKLVRSRLSDKRYNHTLRVVDEAKKLAKLYGVCEKDATIAAFLHDVAKDLPVNELKQAIIAYNLPEQLFQYDKELWHGPVGASFTKEYFQITNEDILNAIYYHTTGRSGMSVLELIIFVADYIEPARDFPGLDAVREIATTSLHEAGQQTVQNTIHYLMERKQIIHPNTFEAYNDLTKIIRRGK